MAKKRNKQKILNIALLGCERSWSIKAIEEEAKKHGHKITFIKPRVLVIEIDPRLKVTINGIKDLKNFDVLFRRRIVSGYLQSLIAANYMKRHKKLVIPRRTDVGQAHDDKMTQAVKLHQGGVRHLPVFQTLSRKNALRLLSRVDYPIIIKGLIGTKGKKVFKVDSKSAALKTLKKYKYTKVLIQEFVDIKHDRRVFVIGKKVLGVMKRIITEGEYRSNVAQGASIEKAPLSKEVEEIALKATEVLNCDIAGVDIIYRKKRPAVLEINSSPGLEGFSKATGINVADELIFYLERMYEKHLKRIERKKRRKKLKEARKKGLVGGQKMQRKWWQRNIGEIFGSK